MATNKRPVAAPAHIHTSIHRPVYNKTCSDYFRRLLYAGVIKISFELFNREWIGLQNFKITEIRVIIEIHISIKVTSLRKLYQVNDSSTEVLSTDNIYRLFL